MSVFVTIIETPIKPPTVLYDVDASQLIKSSRIIYEERNAWRASVDRRYWIGLTSDPLRARESMASVYPFTFFGVVHAIRADNRADMLNEVLRMKLRDKHTAHGWHELTPDDLTWLRSITDDNYAQMIPQIENDLAAENGVEVRDVTKRKRCAGVIIVPDEPNVEDVEALKRRLLEQAEAELYQ
jgi:hypothetical protein